MKHLFILCFTCFCIKSQAQTPITLTRADFPRPTSNSPLPDSVQITNVTLPNTSAQDFNGANTTWNESNLFGNATYQNYVPLSATSTIFQLAFLSCDFATPLLNAGNFGGANASSAFEFYDYANNSNRLQIKGYGANLTLPGSTIPIPFAGVYSTPDILYNFPITYGDKDSSTSGFTTPLTIPTIGSITIKRSQKRVNEVDAWGSITIPSGTFDVLRVVSQINRIDSIITPLFSFGTPTNPKEYKWLGQTKKAPVLQINGNSMGANFTPTVATFWGTTPASIPQLNDNMNTAVYPNPSNGVINVSFFTKETGDVIIYISSIDGRRVAHFGMKKNAGLHSEVLPLSQIPRGTYFLTIKAGTESTTKSILIQ